jgi:hypothetical protein
VQVLFHTKEAGRVFQLWHCAHRGLYCYGIGSGINAKYGGRARGGRELAAQHLQGRGLACAVGADKAEELALCYPKVQVVYGCEFAELFCKGVHLYGVQCITSPGLKLVLVVYLVFYGI